MPALFVTIVFACSGHAMGQNLNVPGDLTVTGNSTGSGWALFKQGVDFGNGGEAMLNWTPGTYPAGTFTFDINWADGTFTWRDTIVGSTASNKMSLDAANNLILFKSNGTAGIMLAPESGKITLPAGTGDTTGSGIYFGSNTAATLAATSTGAAIFPSQVTLQNGLSVSSGNLNVSSTTAATASATGALIVAGGIAIGKDSFINGLRVGRGPGDSNLNTVLGLYAFQSNVSGNWNTAVGNYALASSTTGNTNSAFGQGALSSNLSGGLNSAFGAAALASNVSGLYNVANGAYSLLANTTGSNNSAIGEAALHGNVNGIWNSSIGSSSMYSNVDGCYNSAIGGSSLRNNTGGWSNSSIGVDSLYSNVTGSNNTGVGYRTGKGNTTGSNNVFLGVEAGSAQANGTTPLITNGSVYIGANSRGYDNNDSNSIVIGANAVGAGANTTVIGSSSTIKTRLYGNIEVADGSVAPVPGQTEGGFLALGTSAASGQYSVAVGLNTTASGYLSSATGYSSTASASYSRAGGSGSQASANFSTANGLNASATGVYSFSSGRNTVAKSSYETVFGLFNLVSVPYSTSIVANDLDALFRLGNGSSIGTPSDALTVLKNGQTTLTNKAWKVNVVANPNTPTTALATPTSTSASGGNALVVDGHTVLNGKVIISVPQGDISMGIYGN
jgi:hypothetical protein